MLTISQANSLSVRLIQICFFLILSVCFLPESLTAEPLPLITMDEEKNSTSLIRLKTDDGSELLQYAKKLQVQSQIIAKDYFYISQGLREDKARVEIEQSIKDTDNILSILINSIKNPEMQNLLQYLRDIHMESKGVLKENYSKENASLVIDFSEILYEGTQSVIQYLLKDTKNISSLYDDVMQQKLILQRISKFYIAYQVGFNDETMFQKLEESVRNFEKGLKSIKSHEFANDEQEFASVRLGRYWSISKKFYEGMEKGELTLIVFVSTDHMVSYLDSILKLEAKQ